jgi:predicted transcriptional regulator YdeE
MKYEIQDLTEMKIQGITTRTDNQEGMRTIPQLWETFFKEDIPSQIKGNADKSTVFAVYTGYESDENGRYTLVIGAKISSSDEQNNLTLVNIPSGRYAVFTAPSKEKVIDTWQEVWQINLNRTFIADFEQYDLTTGEVKVYVGLKK